VAELRPYEAPSRPQTLGERIAELEAKGLVIPAKVTPEEFKRQLEAFVGARVPGALQRFLDDRD
jgi:hypothetical protein